MKIVDNPQYINGIRVVQDEKQALEALIKGEVICRFEFGDSMAPILRNGEYAFLFPVKHDELDQIKRGDAVFCEMSYHGQPFFMTHMVWEISDCGFDRARWFKIGSTGTDLYGWTKNVYAIAKGTDYFQKVPKDENKWWDLFSKKK